MSREIKFRVYDHEHKTMGRVIGWSRYELMEDVGNVVYYVGDKTSLQPTDSERIAIMQYTGIKDKNGKEIYEGDLVSTDLSRKFNIVSYRAGGFVYECHDEGEDYYDRMLPCWDNEDTDKHGEVIGNIYENKELLEDDEV